MNTQAQGVGVGDLTVDEYTIDDNGKITLGAGIFPVTNGDLSVSGASQATVNLDGTLDAMVSGASTVYYIGEPTMGDIHVSGESTINKK